MELKVVIRNETSGETESTSQQPQTTSGQQKINKAKEQKSNNISKQIGTTALAVAQTGLSIYSQYSSVQNSLQGNTEYSNRVATINSYLQKGLSVGGSFLMGTAMSGGNVVVGGISAVLSIGGQVASELINMNAINTANAITSTSNNISVARLGSANNIWRK